MFKIVSVKSISATGAAAVVGTLVAFLAPIAPAAIANPQIESNAQTAHVKGDRLPVLVTGRACSSQSWPNYDRGCQFDLRRPADEVRTVRVVNLEKPQLLVAIEH